MDGLDGIEMRRDHTTMSMGRSRQGYGRSATFCLMPLCFPTRHTVHLLIT